MDLKFGLEALSVKNGLETALNLKTRISSAKVQGNMKEVDDLEKQLGRLYNKVVGTSFEKPKKL